MKAHLTNKTLPGSWFFEIEKAPSFPGSLPVNPSDADLLLLGGFVDSRYTVETLFLVSKNTIFIKRFSNAHDLKDIFVQITVNQAIIWLFKNGYLADPDALDIKDLLKKAVYETPMITNTNSLHEHIQRKVKKNLKPEYPTPNTFMEGESRQKAKWPPSFNSWD